MDHSKIVRCRAGRLPARIYGLILSKVCNMKFGTGKDRKTDEVDFEKYIMLRTLSHSDIETGKGRRLIFIGDVHGSYDPLQ